jgi:LmbE family N-acetylglucosaminyl deacetylase
MNRILVISPHPDDEAIGCGGTLLRHVEQGDVVHVLFLTSGEKGGHGRSETETVRIREEEATEASKILGLEQVEFWRAPDGGLQLTEDLVQRLGRRLEEWNPSVVYVTHGREMHPDHRTSARLIEVALDQAKRSPPDVLMYEVWTPIQQIDEITDISPYIENKLRAIRAYESQCDAVDFEAAVRGLNRYRGEMHSWPGGDYAEVFTRLRL